MGTYVLTTSNATDILGAAQDEANSLIAQRNLAYSQDQGITVADSAHSTVNILDDGIVEAAFDFARGVYETMGATFQDVLDFSQGSNQSAAQVSSDAANEIATAYQTAEGVASPITSAHLTTALIVAGAVAALLIIRKKRASK